MIKTAKEIQNDFLATSKLEIQPIDYKNRSDNEKIISLSDRIIALGFPECEQAKNEKVQMAREENAKIQLLELRNKCVKYYTDKYPCYKFISEQSVKNLCKKYKLSHGSSKYYIGDIPKANIEHIEKFKISTEDECFFSGDPNGVFFSRKHINFVHMCGINEKNKCGFEIVAPEKDFNFKDKNKFSYLLNKTKDPIVLCPVFFPVPTWHDITGERVGEKAYLIVTAWGLEAGDESVLNPIHN